MDFNVLKSFLEKAAAATPELQDTVGQLQSMLAGQNKNQPTPEGKSVLNPELKKKKEIEDIFLGSTLKDLDKKEQTLFGRRPKIKTSMLQIICKKAADKESLLRILCKKLR
jgi:hypothetical protein